VDVSTSIATVTEGLAGLLEKVCQPIDFGWRSASQLAEKCSL